MKLKAILLTLSLIILIFCSCIIKPTNTNNNLNYVPNEETAIKIAEAIWYPIYGKDIRDKKPYVAKLIDNKIWVVRGTMPDDYIGGVPYIEIQKSDCKILKVTHGK
ncbi:YbbC/YhhH family protein [Chryseobacterium arthrosphaerae]|uniref:YbbC/YhhH family protein n=1 Tax=Chryseobacterium arthrosphaerae TaxID=651561 RepID=UPI0023E1EDA9|nr:YbbC/YhhH family protein [Chryseobacterium arthrosphaerae]WES99255.1 YbbC/YhhH family protein [Chryseobacterium arthrosphaerae]